MARKRSRNKRANRRAAVRNSTTSAPARWFVDWVRQRDSDSGVEVNGKTALGYAPVWYGVNKIASRVGQLPLLLYRVKGKKRTDREEAVTHPAYRLMRDYPSPLMTPAVFKETLMQHILLWGNGRAAIVRSLRNDPVELIPMLPDRTTTVLIGREDQTADTAARLVTDRQAVWEKWHRVTINGQHTFVHDDDCLHIPGLGYDGIVGYSLIDFCKNSIGLGIAAERHTARVYRNGATPGIILKAPKGTFRKEEEATEFLRNFREFHEGADNAGKTALLREGIELQTLTMSSKDSETAAHRLSARQETAMLFLLESIIGDNSSVSYNSLEQKNRAELINTLGRWLRRWTEECNRKLLTWDQQLNRTHEFQWDTQELLTATLAETMTFLGSAIDKRILNPNEARDWLGYAPYKGGDVYENPNTSSGKAAPAEPDDEDPEPPPPPADATALRRQNRALIGSRLQEVLGVEINRVRAAAANPGTFLDWVDEFYGPEHFGAVITRTYAVVGDNGTWATYHIDVSKAALLEAANVTADQFSAKVNEVISAWPVRAEQYAECLTVG